MEYSKITAIIRTLKIEEVERRLQEIGVSGISISRVKGYGEYKNFFKRDFMVSHVQVEIFSSASKAEEIVQVIMEAAHSGLAGDGIIAIIPVERIYRIRYKTEATVEGI
jgi:nitrogen regulatory protein P-II 1